MSLNDSYIDVHNSYLRTKLEFRKGFDTPNLVGSRQY